MSFNKAFFILTFIFLSSLAVGMFTGRFFLFFLKNILGTMTIFLRTHISNQLLLYVSLTLILLAFLLSLFLFYRLVRFLGKKLKI